MNPTLLTEDARWKHCPLLIVALLMQEPLINFRARAGSGFPNSGSQRVDACFGPTVEDDRRSGVKAELRNG